MPALTNLARRLNQDPQWRTVYIRNFPMARLIAEAMPILHVSGHPDRMSFAEVLINFPDGIPTSDENFGYCSDRTRRAEDKLKLGSCVYFYAGRAHKDFGNVALAFSAGCEKEHNGSVTPYDSGGLAAGFIQFSSSKNCFYTPSSYTYGAIIKLGKWRAWFAHFLAAYFEMPEEYWSGRPWKDDPEGIFFNEENEWRAWAFEIRFWEPQCFSHAIAWCTTKDHYIDLRSKAITEDLAPPPGALDDPLSSFLKTPPVDIEELFDVDRLVEPCDVIEGWVMKRVGL